MEVILVRHAKAETWQPGQSDFDRVLIHAGIERMQAKLPDLEKKITRTLQGDSKAPRQLVLWVSPAARTKQTADIILKVLPTTRVEEHEWIWDQVNSAFERSLDGLEEDALIMIVGHQPSLSYWSEIMTGEYISFRTSGVVSFVKQKGQRKWHKNWVLP